MMKKSVGLLGMILGGLCLALEVYMLGLVQGLDKASGSWHTDPWLYAWESPYLVAFILTAGIIVFSAAVFFKGKD